jgi:hypothetical protein
MKSKLLTIFVIASVFLSFSKDSCDLEEMYERALTKLKKYQLVQDYKMHQKKSKSEPQYQYFQFTVSSGVKYRLYAIDNPDQPGRLVINLYNNMNREFLVASSYNNLTQKMRESIEFTSQSTANFCIGLYFKDGEKGCGVAISSFLPN